MQDGRDGIVIYHADQRMLVGISYKSDRNHTDRLWGRTSNNGQTAQTADTLPAILRVVLNNGIEMAQLGSARLLSRRLPQSV